MIAHRKFVENDFHPGMGMLVDLYYCAIQRKHVVFDYILTDNKVTTRNHDGVYQVFLILFWDINFLLKIFLLN